MKTAREVAHRFLGWAANILSCKGRDENHNEACDRLTAVIEARDAEHRAASLTEARLREALDGERARADIAERAVAHLNMVLERRKRRGLTGNAIAKLRAFPRSTKGRRTP